MRTTPAERGRTDKRILVLTSDTGSGHRSVSRALTSAALERQGIELVEVDPLAPLPGAFRPDGEDERVTGFDRFIRLYGPTIVRAPWLWGWAFHTLNNELGLRAYLATVAAHVGERIAEAVTRTSASAMISVHPLVNQMMVRARDQLERPDIPLMTVLTDLVDIHRWWAATGVDQYVASSDVAAGKLADLDIAPQRIATLGIPIPKEFGSMAVSAREMRQKLGLDPDLPVLLLMGGGDGAGKLPQTARAIAERVGPQQRFQLVVITGRNARARIHLEARPLGVPSRILGFTSDIAQYMTAADVVATKPGSLTISEALALARPLLLGRPLPGQEEGNVSYIVNNGAGLAYRNPAEAAEAAAFMLTEAAARWEMGQRAARLSHPRATERTLDLLQALLLQAEARRGR